MGREGLQALERLLQARAAGGVVQLIQAVRRLIPSGGSRVGVLTKSAHQGCQSVLASCRRLWAAWHCQLMSPTLSLLSSQCTSELNRWDAVWVWV